MSGDSVNKWLLAHAALVISLGLVVVTVFRVLQFTLYDANAAYLVLGHVDRAGILTSTLAQLFVVALPYAVLNPAFFGWMNRGARDGRSEFEMWRSAAFPVLWVPALFLATPLMLFIPLSYLAGVKVSQWRGRRVVKRLDKLDDDNEKDKYIADVNATSRLFRFIWAVSLVVLALLSLAQPWVPKERLELNGSATGITGYVVSDRGDEWLVRTDDRDFKWIASGDVADRQLCLPGNASWWATSIASKFFKPHGVDCHANSERP